MSVTAQTTVYSYSGNGAITSFAYSCRILEDSDLIVTVDGTVKTLTTHYTVTGTGEGAGGTVVFIAAPANGTTVVITRALPYTRGTDYLEGGSFPAETVNADFDRLVMMMQQLSARLDVLEAA